MRFRVPSSFLAALLALAPPCAARADGGEADAERARLRAALALTLEPGGGGLASLPHAARPLLVEVLDTRRVPTPDGAERALDAEVEEAVLAALARLPRAELAALLEADLEQIARAARLARVRILARVGSAAELELLVRVAGALDGRMAEELAHALAALLARDASAYAPLGELLLAAPSPLRAALLDGVAPSPPARTAPGAEAVWLLARSLGRERELDLGLIAALGRLCEARAGALDEWVLRELRRFLASDASALAREAAVALGRSEDPRAADGLVRLLAHESQGVRASAYWALRRIAGVELPCDRERWRSYCDAEAAWFEQAAPERLARVLGGTPEQVAAALGELARHRLFRHELARELAALAQRTPPETRCLVWSALGQLGSRATLPALIGGLDDPEPAVRDAALRALRVLTGASLPPEPEVWLSAFGPPGVGLSTDRSSSGR